MESLKHALIRTTQASPKGRLRLEAIGIILIVLYLLVQGARGLWRQGEMVIRYQNLKKEITLEQDQQEQQKRRIDRLQDPRYIELIARDRLGLVKRGEKVYKLVEPEGGSLK